MTTVLAAGDAFDADHLTVDGERFRHYFRARRLAPGDALRVVDGRGSARRGTVVAVGRRRAEVRLGEAAPDNEPSRTVSVWVAPPRPGRAAWMVEKLTEVGARAIHLWSTERAPRRYGAANLDRLRRVATAAMEQCERSRVPEIEVCSWAHGLERLRDVERRWLLVPGAPHPAVAGTGAGKLALLVGPEGGWTGEEEELLAALPSRRIGLGPTILRVETAAVVGTALALAPAVERGR